MFFFCTKEDKFWILLARSTFHLDESLNCKQFIQADDLVACWYIKALFHNIRCNQNIQLSLFELFKGFLKLILGKFDTSAWRKLA